MNKETRHKRFFHLTSIITDYFPAAGAHFLDMLMKNLLGNKILLRFFSHQSKRRIENLRKPNRFLIAADLNMGDAIISSSGVIALRKIFPQAEIDFVIKKSVKDLFSGDPDISNLFPIYQGAPYPTEVDLFKLSHIVDSKEYDLIINYSPMISDKTFGKNRVVNYSLMAAHLIRNEKFVKSINNVSYQAYLFIINLFRDYLPSGFNLSFEGSVIYLSEEAIESATEFLIRNNVPDELPIIMFNPDASAKFTMIPFDIQLDLLKRLCAFECTILLGAGHVEKYIERKLLRSLPEVNRKKIIIIPVEFKLDAYTALIDFADIFITGDTGPLHLAAARKYSQSQGGSLRNKTAVYSIFGSTPPRIYGFDSETPGFFAANQDAPSRVFVSEAVCRNITCINKLAKTCREVRCFQSLDINKIVSEVAGYLLRTMIYRNFEKNIIERYTVYYSPKPNL